MGIYRDKARRRTRLGIFKQKAPPVPFLKAESYRFDEWTYRERRRSRVWRRPLNVASLCEGFIAMRMREKSIFEQLFPVKGIN